MILDWSWTDPGLILDSKCNNHTIIFLYSLALALSALVVLPLLAILFLCLVWIQVGHSNHNETFEKRSVSEYQSHFLFLNLMMFGMHWRAGDTNFVAPGSTKGCALWHSTRMGLHCQYHGPSNWWCCGVRLIDYGSLVLPQMQWNSYGSPINSLSSWCETGFLVVAMRSYRQY